MPGAGAAATADGVPDLQGYVADSGRKTEQRLEEQNRAAEAFHRWNRKGDACIGVLTLLAIALFLFGLAQALASRLRLFFALGGTFAAAASLPWSASILILPGGD